jgi:hypothetical protein
LARKPREGRQRPAKPESNPAGTADASEIQKFSTYGANATAEHFPYLTWKTTSARLAEERAPRHPRATFSPTCLANSVGTVWHATIGAQR